MSKRILIVDDSKLVRDLLIYMVSTGGYEAETAESGADALELLARGRYELALVDLNMPLMDGYELTRRIRAMDSGTELPIVIVTTEAEAESKTRGIEAGADLYMVKPVQEPELLANIQMLIGAADD